MNIRTLLAILACLSLTTPPLACGSSNGNERWVTTENTNVDIDWDQIGEAYKKADGPEDFEKRVNEIYTGSEIISVSVQDVDAQTQVVTGFFDKDKSGTVTDPEKVFTIKREITGESQGRYQIHGYNHYGHYRSPMWDIAGGMLMGSMLSRAFMPGYAPVYTRPYVTSPARVGTLTTHRNTYRSKNPSRFPNHGKRASSRSGRSYGSKSRSRTRSFGGRSRGGGGFGIKRRANLRVVRLTA